MVLVFDLDDTLYRELSFVESGFKAVANHLEAEKKIPQNESLNIMLNTLKTEGRGQVFDSLLGRYDLNNKRNVSKCISIYRGHRPEIRLFPEAERCLQRFKNWPLYIVTDGNKQVQHNKLLALGLYKKVKFCYITHRYGVKHAKPSPYCFNKICAREKVSPQKVYYIADNPNKDFVGIKPSGFKTVRVLTGHFKSVRLAPEFEAQYQITSLDQLTTSFLFSNHKEGGLV